LLALFLLHAAFYGTGTVQMIGRRRFLMIAALGAVPFTHMGMLQSALQGADPKAQEHELPQDATEPKQERKPAQKASNRLIVINPGHYKRSGENLGAHVPGIGHEYIINTQIARAMQEKLRDAGLQAIVTRNEQDYLPEIVKFMADHHTRLETEYDAYLKATISRKRRELGRREAILQLGIMRYAEECGAAAMIDIHVDDQPRKRRKRIAEAKGFSVILNKTASCESELLQEKISSALRKTLPLNRCYQILNVRRGILILGNNKLPLSVPSCLVECGFMRQLYVIDENKKHICDPEVQDVYAASLAKGLASYFGI
jgi:N-acetylmuramoyl-L-alanine amidase